MATISKLEYLKRYTDGGGSSSDTKKKKKRKIKPSSKQSRIKILDSDIKFKDESNDMSSDNDEFDLKEERPQVFATDGKTLLTDDYEQKELEKSRKWAPIKTNNTNNTNKMNTFAKKSAKQTKGHSSGSDASPPRRQRTRHDSTESDASPPRKTRHDSDASPPRKQRLRHDSTDSDVSPPRRMHHNSSNTDLSPPRSTKVNRNSQRKRYNSSDSDLSPSRIASKNSDRNSNYNKKTHRKEERPEIIKAGTKVGLKSSADVRKENQVKLKEGKALMDTIESGKGAETIYRDRKSGKQIDLRLEKMKKQEKEKQYAKDKEQFSKWGKGITQTNEYKEKLQSDVYEMSKPLSRYKNDNDLDQMLKDRDRAEDPMLAFMQKKKVKSQGPAKPRYKGPPPPPNRFSIWPGYRWDGVDRSNGFEKKRFTAISNSKTREIEAFKWSTEEM